MRYSFLLTIIVIGGFLVSQFTGTPGLKQLLLNEGGYSNVTGDTGGETYRGISRNNFPHWEGWRLVDQHKPLKDEQIIADNTLDSEVVTFYLRNFWDENRLGEINNQNIAGKLLDMSVNMGSYRAIIILQQTLVNDMRISVNIDGKIGSETISAINRASAPVLLQKIRGRCVAFYEGLVEKKPSNKKFLSGWLRRANQ